MSNEQKKGARSQELETIRILINQNEAGGGTLKILGPGIAIAREAERLMMHTMKAAQDSPTKGQVTVIEARSQAPVETTKLPSAGKSKLDLLPSWKKLPAKEKLAVLLNHFPGLTDKLIEALETDRFIVTLSFQKKYKPDDPNDLQHFYCRQGYPVNDVIPSLRHVAADFAGKEMPNAEVGGEGWH